MVWAGMEGSENDVTKNGKYSRLCNPDKSFVNLSLKLAGLKEFEETDLKTSLPINPLTISITLMLSNLSPQISIEKLFIRTRFHFIIVKIKYKIMLMPLFTPKLLAKLFLHYFKIVLVCGQRSYGKLWVINEWKLWDKKCFWLWTRETALAACMISWVVSDVIAISWWT